jgi:hypothetical protein
MLKTALFAITLAVSAGANAADINGICAADIRKNFAAEVPSPSFQTYPAPAGASLCETAVAKSLSFRPVSFRDAQGRQLRGFESVYYTENGPLNVALVMQTAKEAFYYYEACDICAEIDKCDLKTGQLTRVVAAHSADCSDLAHYAAGAVYSACPKPVNTCAKVGDAVRIPDECCSKTAENAYGGEMVCVEAVPAGSTCAKIGEDVRIPDECCSGNAEPNSGGEMTCIEAARAVSPFAR